MKSEKQPGPNMKNKTFVAWQRSETCKKQEDNLVSSDWHEKLKRMGKFVPVYDNRPVDMVLLMSGEYGRIWLRERDEWFKTSYIPQPRLLDLQNRQKKIRKAAKEAKKAAQANAMERKKQREKEIEAKKKAKAEELEKLKQRVRKITAPKIPQKTPKAKKKATIQSESSPVEETTPESSNFRPEEKGSPKGSPKDSPKDSPKGTPKDTPEGCPKGWKPVEVTLQCPDKKDNTETNEEVKEEQNLSAGNETEQNAPAGKETDATKEGCVMCEGYVEQMKKIHEKTLKEATEECERGAEAQ